jgi:uncharacterized protein (TIRG00374 family)
LAHVLNPRKTDQTGAHQKLKISINRANIGRLFIGFAISGVFLWLAFRNTPLPGLFQALGQADYRWLILAILFQLAAVLARAERWRKLLQDQIGVSEAVWALGIGYLFTNILPFRLGEPARVAVISSRDRLPLARVATTAVLERLADLATILLFLVGVIPLVKVPTGVLRGGVFFGVIVSASVGIIFGINRQALRSERLVIGWLERLVPTYAKKVATYWREFLNGLTGLRRDTAGSIIVWSLATWTGSVGVYWCVLRAFQPLARPIEAVFMVVALSLALTVPSGPGFVGVFQWVGQQALILPFGDIYDSGSALAITLTAHLVYYIFTTLLGVFGLWRFGQSLMDVRHTIPAKQPGIHDQSSATQG